METMIFSFRSTLATDGFSFDIFFYLQELIISFVQFSIDSSLLTYYGIVVLAKISFLRNKN